MATSYRQGRVTNVSSSRSMCVPLLLQPFERDWWDVAERWAFTDELISRFLVILIDTIIRKSTRHVERI